MPVASASEQSPAVTPDAAYFAILRTIGLFRRVMEPYFARYGLSGAQWAVLINLHCAARDCAASDGAGVGADGEQAADKNRGAMRLADLGGKLLVSPPSVTHVVERLRVAGLLVRETSPTDHRAKYVRLTDAGRERVEKILRQHDRQIATVLAGLDAPELLALRGLLGKLNTHLERVVPTEHGLDETPANDNTASENAAADNAATDDIETPTPARTGAGSY